MFPPVLINAVFFARRKLKFYFVVHLDRVGRGWVRPARGDHIRGNQRAQRHSSVRFQLTNQQLSNPWTIGGTLTVQPLTHTLYDRCLAETLLRACLLERTCLAPIRQRLAYPRTPWVSPGHATSSRPRWCRVHRRRARRRALRWGRNDKCCAALDHDHGCISSLYIEQSMF